MVMVVFYHSTMELTCRMGLCLLKLDFSSPPPGGSNGRAATRKRAMPLIPPSPPNIPSSPAGAESIISASVDELMLTALEK